MSRRRLAVVEAPVGTLAVDGAGAIHATNRAAAELLGAAGPTEIDGRTIASIFAPTSAERIRARLAELSQGADASFTEELAVVRADGCELPVCATFDAAAGAGAGVRVSLRSLETHCPLHERLELHESRFATLLNNLQVGVVVQGPAAEMLLWNPKALELLGLTEDHLRGVTSFDPRWSVIREDGRDFPGPEHPVPVAIATRRPVRGVVMGVHRPASSDRVWLLVDAEPQLDASGAVETVVCTFTDITARKQLEDSLLRAGKLELIGRLAGSVAHDFNNLLSVIACSAELLEGELSDEDDHRTDVRAIREAALRGATLTRQLLSLSGKDVARPERSTLGRLLARSEPLLRRAVGEGIECRVVPPREDPTVRIDPSSFEHILLNLALNARDAMPRGGHFVVASRLGPRVGAAATVELTVSDTGEGIAAQHLSRVFEPFFTTKRGTGTGLGLSSVRALVEQAHGAVRVESELGRGATFVVELPVEAEAVDPESERRPRRTGGGETILVVDDDAALRGAVSNLLRSQGYVVLAAADGEDALAIVRAHQPQLVLTDIIMRRMSGVALRRAMADIAPDVPVLFMSGYTDEALERLGVGAAGVDFIRKPFDGRELQERIEGLLRGGQP